MQAAMIFAGSGPILVLTSHDGLEDPTLLARLAGKGIRKFIAYPVPIEVLQQKYGAHFDIVCERLDESDDLRVLDFDGRRAMELLPFSVLGKPIFHEPS
ncbi:MAG TPA: hypothetical protein PKK06_07635 [Phycisphaerae bacterium]|nr:hypothetical protein [Phycisphaerae bacterium]HNU46628.1 hypothetical protein [Phycisphaerae bacterium]